MKTSSFGKSSTKTSNIFGLITFSIPYFREKYDKKVEKLMMFVYSIMNQSGKDALGSFSAMKMLPSSDSSINLPENQENQKSSPIQEQLHKSPQNLPQHSPVSTLPNTPANPFMMANPNLINGQFMPMPTYNAQPYFSDSSSSSSQFNNNPTATTSGNMFRNPKLSRPAPNMETAESQEFKGFSF